MKTVATPYGRVHSLAHDNLYAELLVFITHAAKRPAAGSLAAIALSGGSSPKAFYQWALQHPRLWARVADKCLWTTSDERCVPLEDGASNFGNAERMLLDPLKIPQANKFPWPVDLPAGEAASAYNHQWKGRFSAHQAYDLCLLGMGDDCHTASLFPHCPLIGGKHRELFAAVEWPGKGWRLTITPEGLSKCQRIVVCVTGGEKAAALRDVFHGSFAPLQKPVQLLKAHAYKTDWLLDEEAASALDF